jgi:hypothetical protein
MSYTRDVSQTIDRPKAHGEVLTPLEQDVTSLLSRLDQKERVDDPDREEIWTLISKRVPQAVEAATEAVDLDTTKKLAWLGAQLAESMGNEKDPLATYDRVTLGLEGIREVLRDFREGPGIWASKGDNELIVWLVQSLPGIPQAQVASLLNVSPKTIYRWQGGGGSTEYHGQLRALAAVVAQLRFSMTPIGIISWLRQPQADKRTPLEKLATPADVASVIRSAMELRGV